MAESKRWRRIGGGRNAKLKQKHNGKADSKKTTARTGTNNINGTTSHKHADNDAARTNAENQRSRHQILREPGRAEERQEQREAAANQPAPIAITLTVGGALLQQGEEFRDVGPSN